MQFFYCRKRKNWRAGELNGLNLDHQTKESQVTNYQRKLEYRILPQRRLSIVFFRPVENGGFKITEPQSQTPAEIYKKKS
jgi:hypothetical protein